MSYPLIFVIGLFVGFFILIRNNLVFKIRSKALSIISEKANNLINQGYYNDWQVLYRIMDNPSYYAMVFKHITKWRFKDFYPQLK